MKASKFILGLFILIILTSITFAQKQFIHTVTSPTNCNATCSVLDIPEINPLPPNPPNPDAILFITQIGGNSNPHPIGAYYMYLNKWSVFNMDAKPIPVGAQFKVEYYTPDANHFVYTIPPRVHTGDPAWIDNPGLNNNPNAQIRVFPHCSASIGNTWNQLEVKVEYDKAAAKWFIANLNGTPVNPGVAYNVMFSQGYSVINDKADKTLNTTPKTPISNSPIKNGSITPERISSDAPSGNAGGDLSGTYPNPTVIGLQGKSLSSNPPRIGQILKWNGSAWEPADENSGAGSSTTYTAGAGLDLNGNKFTALNYTPIWNANKIYSRPIAETAPTIGQVLKWNGTAWEPAADNVAANATPTQTPAATVTPAMKTFFKNGGATSPQIPGNAPYVISDLTQTIILDKNSRLIISEITEITSPICVDLGCNGTQGWLKVNIDGNAKLRVRINVNANSTSSVSISNFMIDLSPGTHTVTFEVSHLPQEGLMRATGNQSSIIVIPLE